MCFRVTVQSRVGVRLHACDMRCEPVGGRGGDVTATQHGPAVRKGLQEDLDDGNPMAVNDKRTLYVGGLDESVTEATVRAAFVPFGDLTDVSILLDAKTQKHKGFAFVQYNAAEDAADAIDNMHNAELYGRVLRVNLAKPDALKGGTNRPSGKLMPTSSSLRRMTGQRQQRLQMKLLKGSDIYRTARTAAAVSRRA